MTPYISHFRGLIGFFYTVLLVPLANFSQIILHAATDFLLPFAETVMSFLQLLTDKLSDRYSLNSFCQRCEKNVQIPYSYHDLICVMYTVFNLLKPT